MTRGRSAYLSGFVLGCLPSLAYADEFFSGSAIQTAGLTTLIGTLAVTFFGVIFLVRQLRMTKRASHEQAEILSKQNMRLNQLETVLSGPDQRLIVLDEDGNEIEAFGRLPGFRDMPEDGSNFETFEDWLDPDSAIRLKSFTKDLVQEGSFFTIDLTTTSGDQIEASGRIAGNVIFLLFTEAKAERRSAPQGAQPSQTQPSDLEGYQSFLDQMDFPVWINDRDQQLIWKNEAYDRQFASDDQNQLASPLQMALKIADPQSTHFDASFPLKQGTEKRATRLLGFRGEDSTFGAALDESKVDRLKNEVEETQAFFAKTINHFANGVALFDKNRRLKSFNSAFEDFWKLDREYLKTEPSDSELLDELRSRSLLPHQADFKHWKKDVLEVVNSNHSEEMWWHLPDARTLRVHISPHPNGGIVHIYEDVTERLELQSLYRTLEKVQGETLNALKEAVVFFGSDGRLKLHNPAFSALWDIPASDIEGLKDTHVSDLAEHYGSLDDRRDLWNRIVAHVTVVNDHRPETNLRAVLGGETVIDCAILPLPDGATLVTFADSSAQVKAETALRERNEALEQSHKMKTAFVRHASYELRSPLTNIIGFAEMLELNSLGELTEQQAVYVDHILSSGKALHVVADNMLDLATLEAGILELDLKDIAVKPLLTSVLDDLNKKLKTAKLLLRLRIATDVITVFGDERRLRQIIYNLLSNAITYSSAGGQIELSVARKENFVVIRVRDEGHGIPKSILPTIFDLFESHAVNGRKGGAGLGLAIVKQLVELHGGTINLRSEEGVGTTVAVRLPISQAQNLPSLQSGVA